MFVMHVCEIIGSLTPCAQMRWDAHRADTLALETMLDDLKSIDAHKAPIEEILQKIEAVGAMQEKIAAQESFIRRLDELLASCKKALDDRTTHLEVAADIAAALAPYRDTALEFMLDRYTAAHGDVPQFARGHTRSELLASMKQACVA